MYVSKISLRNFKSFPNATVKLDHSFSAIVGPNGSGKCLRGDSIVTLTDGRGIKIRDLVESEISLSANNTVIDDGVISLENRKGLRVFSLNPSTGKIEKKRIQAFVKRTSPEKLLKIKTSSGKEIISTLYHPVMTVKDGIICSAKAEELSSGSFVATPRSLVFDSKETNLILPLATAQTDLYLPISSSFRLASFLRSKKQVENKTWKKIASEAGVPFNLLSGLLDGQAVQLFYANLLARWAGLDSAESTVLFRTLKAKNHYKQVSLPVIMSNELAKFLGYVISEGRIASNEVFFYNDSPALRKDFSDCCFKLFGFLPTECKDGEKIFLILPSKVVTVFLEIVFGLESKQHSSKKRIPELLFSSTQEQVACFVSALYDGDGSVSLPSSRKVCVEYVSASEKLIKQLHLLLLKFGIASRVSVSLKSATNTVKKIKRPYYRLNGYGLENARAFANALAFSIEKRPRLLKILAGRTLASSSVDLIPSSNSIIKRALAAQGFSGRKLKSITPSKIRAYYENRCLPTRNGLKAVVSLIQPCEERSRIEMLSLSEIFWDKIDSIEDVPGEEWVYDLCVEENHNFLSEGIFVHNSNVVDGLMFAFGENRLKSMRVKTTKDLIFQSHNLADVAVELRELTSVGEVKEVEENGKKKRVFPNGVHELRRVVRKDGKTKYLLDGRKVKRYVIEEFLSKNMISLQNVIKQGEVQRIVEMNSKERRGLIDFVANVSEYEEKKKEAFVELGKVNEKLKEGETVLAEREGYIKELEEDKKNAERFLELEKELKSVKASILYTDVVTLEKEFESLVNSNLDANNKVEALRQKTKELDDKVSLKLQEKDVINKTISERSAGREVQIQREIDALNASMQQAQVTIEEKKAFLAKEQGRIRDASLEKQKAVDEVKGAEARINQANEDVTSVQRLLDADVADLNRLMQASNTFSKDYFGAKQTMEQASSELLQTKEKLNALQAEVSAKEEIRRMKEAEILRLKKGQFVLYDEKKKLLVQEKSKFEGDLRLQEKRLSELFSQEKQSNQSVLSLEEEILSASEKLAEAESKLRTVGDSGSKTIEAIMALRESISGIHGTLQELIDYDSKYSVPISVALGQRLTFVVVDSVKTAGKAIDYLKKNRLGRVSFIPLDKIAGVPPTEKELLNARGVVSDLVKLLKYDSSYRKAVEYACGNTVLVRDFASAEELAGEGRLVTIAGELFEASGLVTGGTVKEKVNVFKETANARELEQRLKNSKAERESLVQSLYQLRDLMSSERKKKAEIELSLKSVELELKHLTDEERQELEKKKDLLTAISTMQGEANNCIEWISKADEERSELIRSMSSLNVKYLEAKQKIDVEKEAHFGTMVKEKEHKISELRISLSQVQNQLNSLETQKNVYARQLVAIQKQEAEQLADVKEAESQLNACGELIKSSRVVLQEKIAEQKKVSKAISDLIEAREKIEVEVVKLGNEKGKLQFEIDKVSRDQQEFQLKRVAVETRLTDLKSQFDQFSGVPILKKEKPDLLVSSKKISEEINLLGTINLRAIELYSQKAEEIIKQKERVQQLFNEKNAVMALISEIESKKISTFMQAFNQINEAFKTLFKQIFQGAGTLFLENPDNPFDGGLTIQVKLDNKEVKYLELMSGGEKSLIALLFLFALQSSNSSSIYILDEADAALDQENSRKLSLLIKELAKKTQFITVSHNETLYKRSDCLIGVAMSKEGSRIVEVKLSQEKENSNQEEKKEI